MGKEEEFHSADHPEQKRDTQSSRSSNKSKTPSLDMFGRDLVKMASEDKLDPVIGREEEIDKLIQILNKKRKNNPIIVGEAGSGKTSLIEALAIKIAKKDVDRWLINKRIIELNLTSVISGTKYRGEFEQRMEDIVREVRENPDVIIFIDEIHNIIGAGGASGSMDASNIIKPALARGEMRCIGATTLEEYKKTIENESALERRFQKVHIDIPTKEQTLEILKKIRYKYEEYHNVKYSDEVLEKCVEYSDKYINYRNFPDKAIDVMDEVGVKAKMKLKISEDIKNMQKELQIISEEKKKAAVHQDYEKAARLRDKEKEMKIVYDEVMSKWDENLKTQKIEVTVDDVVYVISSNTGIPLSKLTESDNDKIYSLESYLNSTVIGQSEAVKKVCEAIQRFRIGINDPNKPQNFIFLGISGVGKTYLARTLADYLFNTSDSFIRFDMTEFSEKHSISKLIGAPAGYVGYEEKGQLTEKVKNRPYSVILFDEIEKAHPDIFNIFLQIFDEGKLTDNTGKEVNFKNTIIIMTSNIGTDKILDKKPLGFDTNFNETKNISDTVLKELKKVFKPELINRIDEKIVFNPLSEENISKIVDLEIEKVIKRISEKGYSVNVTKEVREYIAKIGYEKEYGARPLKRAIVNNIENIVSNAIFNKKVTGKQIKLIFDKKLEQVIAK